jgi:hypothetical protein
MYAAERIKPPVPHRVEDKEEKAKEEERASV